MAIGETLSQQFQGDEKLYRRFPPSHLDGDRVSLAGIGSTVSFPKKTEGPDRHKKSPSCVREHYGTAEDARHPNCANGRPDVKGWGVFSIQVGLLPKTFKSEQGQEFDFYPFHDPIEECPGHTLIHSCHSGAISPQYDDPTRDARNELRTRIFQQHIIELWPET